MELTIESLEPQPVLGIRTETKMTEIGEKIGALMGELAPFVGNRAAGPVVARYHDWEGDRGVMEVAMPVREAAEGNDRIHADQLPGGRAVVFKHIGPYEKLKESWGAVDAAMQEQGLERGGAPWEAYLNDCSVVPPEKLETLIVWPIK